jgi:hypothetical protein
VNGCLERSLSFSPSFLSFFLYFYSLSLFPVFSPAIYSAFAFPQPSPVVPSTPRPVLSLTPTCKSSFAFCPSYIYPSPSLLRFRPAIEEPSPSNLKDRIAALQQHNGSPSPTPSPTSSHRDTSITPPRGSLRDKIAKFERKGGVPIPRGSFGMGMPPPEEAGSTKSRELYGNRVAALGKGRPTAPGNSAHRAVTSPPMLSLSPSSRASPDENAAQSTAHLTPNSISFAASSTPPSLSNTSEPTDRPGGPINVGDGSDEAQEIPVQPVVEPQVESLTVTQDAEPLEPSNSATRPTVSIGHRPPSDSIPSSPTSLDATTLTRGSISSIPLKATSSNGTPTEAGGLATSIVYEKSPTSSESNTQERPPAATPKSTMSTVQASHISVEQVPVKEATTNVNSRGSRLDRPSQNGSSAISSTRSDAPSVTRLPSSSIITSTDSLKERSTSITFDAPTPVGIKSNLLPSNNSTSASTVAFPSAISSTVPRVSGDLDDSIRMSPPPVAEPGRRSFSAVVHRGDSDNHSESRHSTTSRSSTVTPRLSTSSFKTGTDGGVVRSKRNFKHLGAVAAGPPPSPGPGDLSTGELAALLQDAAWLEQQLSGESLALTVPSTLGEEWQKVDISEPLSAIKAAEATTRAPAAVTSARTKGRGLTLGSATSKPSSDIPQSPMRSSPSAPSFQVHPDASPTAPTSARGRKYFSLRSALRGQRLSLSSEMSSDDSALVATPPSPSFDLAMQHSAQHGNDSMSIRSMFSIRSNRSGKSESGPGSLRLSPRRSVARASSFAGRLLHRATKTKSMLDDPGELPSLSFYYRRADPLLNT